MDFRNLTKYKNRTLDVVNVNGRNYLTDSKFVPSVIIGMAFGSNYDGKSHNDKLATTILDARKYFGSKISVIVQSEIGECLIRKGETDFYFVGENYKEGEKSLIKSKIDTDLILQFCLDVIDDKELDKKILYVTHPAHMQRVLNTAKKKGLDGIPFVSEKVEWLDDNPWRVCSPWLWVPREIVARILS